jgi:ABC-type branched-subunit amino acid transport system substrate-binding protein
LCWVNLLHSPGIQFHAGAKLWFERVNDSGGINGRRIDIKKMDDGYEPERCLANTKQLIDDGVFALFGYIGTPTSLAVLPVVKSSQIPFIAPFTGPWVCVNHSYETCFTCGLLTTTKLRLS